MNFQILHLVIALTVFPRQKEMEAEIAQISKKKSTWKLLPWLVTFGFKEANFFSSFAVSNILLDSNLALYKYIIFNLRNRKKIPQSTWETPLVFFLFIIFPPFFFF